MDDAGAEAGACTCAATMGGAEVLVACGEGFCSGGTEYLCTAGEAIVFGTCEDEDGGEDAAGEAGDDGCTPQCNGTTCGNDDGCNGTCGCPGGLPCMAGKCGNGCQQQAGDVCALDASALASPTLCCQSGYACAATEAGLTACCTTTSHDAAASGSCLQDTDCCDYPAVRCQNNATCQ